MHIRGGRIDPNVDAGICMGSINTAVIDPLFLSSKFIMQPTELCCIFFLEMKKI